MWADLRAVFALLSASPDCRAIILTGAGKAFTSGLDVKDHLDLLAPKSLPGSDAARLSFATLPLITSYQDSISAPERARPPVIAAIHGACVGGGVDLVCAADIRWVHTYMCMQTYMHAYVHTHIHPHDIRRGCWHAAFSKHACSLA